MPSYAIHTVLIYTTSINVYTYLDEEGVVRISGGVALRLEQRVEVPERAFHPLYIYKYIYIYYYIMHTYTI